jgi:hypothetical protein
VVNCLIKNVTLFQACICSLPSKRGRCLPSAPRTLPSSCSLATATTATSFSRRPFARSHPDVHSRSSASRSLPTFSRSTSNMVMRPCTSSQRCVPSGKRRNIYLKYSSCLFMLPTIYLSAHNSKTICPSLESEHQEPLF